MTYLAALFPTCLILAWCGGLVGFIVYGVVRGLSSD